MSSFHFRNRQYHCERVPLADIAAQVGTPVYVYSREEIVSRASAVVNQLASDDLACYAVKANANPTILRLIASLGLGADVTSGGELYLALKAGFAPERILFSGVGKTAAEIEQALDANIRALHVESSMELEAIATIAARRGQIAPIGIRVNPDIDAATHPAISTGRPMHKFGVSPEIALSLLQTAARHPNLDAVGLSAHIGSQISQTAPFAQVAAFLVALAQEADSMGIPCAYLDAGGGLGVEYQAAVPTVAEWISAVGQPIHAAGYPLVVEPGRSIVATSAILLTQVVYTKDQGEKAFAIVDASMSDLLRPTLYNAYHPIVSVAQAEPKKVFDIVGSICETGDWLGKSRPMPELFPGDYLAITHAGAYGYAMSSNYNGRLRPAEVLVDGDRWETIRPRQTFADLA